MTFTVFVGNVHYPSGGWEDFEGNFSTLQEAKEFVEKKFSDSSFKWAHIVFDEKIILFGFGADTLKLQEFYKWEWREAL